MGRRLGDADDPLLVSVRSGAKFSMPGMMETVLNIGLNDESVAGLAAAERRRAVRAGLLPPAARRCSARPCSASTSEHFAEALDAAKRDRGTENDLDLDADDLRAARRDVQGASSASTPAGEFPQDPREQLDLAIRAVFDSWNTDRARLYRRQERIPEDLGTAVNVQAMVFGNFGMDSGSGVAFTRDPASGAQGEYGDYLQNAQGEDVVAGIRNTVVAGRLRGGRPRLARRPDDDHGAARAPLPRHVRHRVHRRARQALDAADPGRQAHARRRRSGSPSTWSTRA